MSRVTVSLQGPIEVEGNYRRCNRLIIDHQPLFVAQNITTKEAQAKLQKAAKVGVHSNTRCNRSFQLNTSYLFLVKSN